jgi:ankyrin repeat protein
MSNYVVAYVYVPSSLPDLCHVNNYKDSHNEIPLIRAARHNKVEEVKALIKFRANVNATRSNVSAKT